MARRAWPSHLHHQKGADTEAAKQQTATSEMRRIISDSPLQSVLDAVAETTARLCDANNAQIYRLENNLLRLVASYGEIPAHIQAREGFPVNRDRVMGRAIRDRRSVHVHDLAAEDSGYPSGSSDAKRQGHRTTLGTPLLRERNPIGVILFRRWEVRPFSENQIALLETFADEAVIAIENVRLFEAEKQRTLALVHANRDLAQREAKVRRLADYLAEAQRLSHTGTWAFNETTTLYWSEESYRIWGFDPTQGLPSREAMWERVHPDDRDWVRQEAREARRQRRDYAVEHRILLPDGTVRYLEATARFVSSADFARFEVVGTHVDVTERKRAQEERERLRQLEADLAHMNRLDIMGELAASLAHEIKQPITAVRNYARAALRF